MNDSGCLKCGSKEVLENSDVLDRTDLNPARALTVTVPRDPAAPAKGSVSAALRAKVCCACGFTELYAENPQMLLNAVKQQHRT
jgi:predicted nucleic-acid-binding Zn-ribbon protein